MNTMDVSRLARTLIASCIGVALLEGMSPGAVGPSAPGPAPAPAAHAGTLAGIERHALTEQDLRAFLDGFMPYAIARANIAGAEIAVVKDGKVLLEAGYGYSDVTHRRPVSPDTTLFRPGSIGKLFTWTAVMQQVQRGRIDLDADVNRYLDFSIPPAFGRPITMRELMTHTAGFAESFKGDFDTSPDQLVSLGTFVRTHIPARIFPPGSVVAYSNYGATLAGYIVQRVSGLPYDEYVRRNIFAPLGMAHSTLRQPIPTGLTLSQGYFQASDPPQHFEYIQIAPAGASSTTATDMTKFMLAQLQNGRLGSARILAPQTAKLMHTPQWTAAPGFNGFDLGFYQENRNGQTIIGHAGDTNWFHSDLHLIESANVGFYVAFNSAGSEGAAESVRTDLFRAFLDRYFPAAPPPNERTAPTASADAKLVAGSYEASRREDSAFPLVFLISSGRVTANADGTIAFSVLKNAAGVPKTWREVGPLRYREVGGPGRLVFVRDRNGAIEYLTTDDFIPVFVFQPVPFWKGTPFLQMLGVAILAIFVLTLLIWPIGALVRRAYRQPLRLPRAERRLRLAARITCVLALLDLIGWLVLVSALDKTSVPDGVLDVLYALGVACVVGAVATVADAVVTWRSGTRSVLAKIAETVVACGAAAFAWGVVVFGMANFNVHY